MPIKVPPSPGPSERTANMRANRRRDTGPERELRSALHALGLRFRVDLPVVADGRRPRPDVAFTRARLAVFVDGCFWHGCPEHAAVPTKNARYWSSKIARNIERDREQTRALEAAGWKVVRVWEHEDMSATAKRLAGLVRCGAVG